MRDPNGRESSWSRATVALYSATQGIERKLSDVAWAVHRLGDNGQRAAVDLAFDLASLSFRPVLSRISDWIRDVPERAGALITEGGVELTARQTRHNFEVYNLVKNVRSRLRIEADREVDLAGLVAEAYALGGYAGLWAIEGLGHEYAALQLNRGDVSQGILCDGRAAALPASSLSMMHAGLGLALAERMLPQLTPWSSLADFRKVLTGYIDACDAHGRVGYRGAAYESVGLVARTWHPQLVAGIDAVLREWDEGLAGYFWHGAGRALYFLPEYIVPILSPSRAAD